MSRLLGGEEFAPKAKSWLCALWVVAGGDRVV